MSKASIYAALASFWMDMQPYDPIALQMNYLLSMMVKEGWHESDAEG